MRKHNIQVWFIVEFDTYVAKNLMFISRKNCHMTEKAEAISPVHGDAGHPS
jgi:hypothetical protein